MVYFPGHDLSGTVASLFFILLTMKLPDGFKATGPAYPILARVGEDALLTCQLLPKKSARHMEVTLYCSEPSTPVFAHRDGDKVAEMQMEEYRGRVEWIEDYLAKGRVTLKIHNIQLSDNGKYWCRYQEENYCGETSLQLKVAALGSAPDIHMEGHVESGVQLECTAKGWYPEPQVYWEDIKGEKLLSVSEHHIQDEDGLFMETTLLLRDPAVETVSCFIHNADLHEEKGSEISMPEKLQTELASLQVIGPSQPILVKLGEYIQLTCYLSPKANAWGMEVRWVRSHHYPAVYVCMDGDHVAGEQMEEYRGRTELVSGAIAEGKLTRQIRDARTSGAGQYQCLLEKDGVYQEASLELKVAENRMPSLWKMLLIFGLFLAGAVVLSGKKNCKKVNVTLDPNTAHPELILSKGNKCVTRGHSWQNLPEVPQRFNCLPCVLGQEAFTSGMQYWEVEVGDETGWFLGVVRDDVVRKGIISLSPENGFWIMGCYGNEYWAITSPPTLLFLKRAPRQVRVSLDYASGHLSFYNMTNKCPIYTFPKTFFSGTLHPLFILWSPSASSPDIFPAPRGSSETPPRKTIAWDFGNQEDIPSPSSCLLSATTPRGLTRSLGCQVKVR